MELTLEGGGGEEPQLPYSLFCICSLHCPTSAVTPKRPALRITLRECRSLKPPLLPFASYPALPVATTWRNESSRRRCWAAPRAPGPVPRSPRRRGRLGEGREGGVWGCHGPRSGEPPCPGGMSGREESWGRSRVLVFWGGLRRARRGHAQGHTLPRLGHAAVFLPAGGCRRAGVKRCSPAGCRGVDGNPY